MAKSRKHKSPKYKVTRISSSNKRRERISTDMAIIGFLLNLLILPGLGSIIAGKTRIGIWQVILFFIGGIGLWFNYILFGILVIAVWVWALVTGIQMLRESR